MGKLAYHNMLLANLRLRLSCEVSSKAKTLFSSLHEEMERPRSRSLKVGYLISLKEINLNKKWGGGEIQENRVNLFYLEGIARINNRGC